jgi:hypothetical protein
MGAVHAATADLTTVIQHLERLAARLRGSGGLVPEVSAACDALTCAAVLLRTQDVGCSHSTHTELLYDAIALARSTVESTKFACWERAGSRPGAR